MLHLATSFPRSDFNIVAGVSLEVLWSKKTNLKLNAVDFELQFFVYVHMCKCLFAGDIMQCVHASHPEQWKKGDGQTH